MKLKELLDVYATPEFETLEVQDLRYNTFYKCYGMNEIEKDRPDLLDCDIVNFVAYPGGMENDSIKFIVRIDM